MQKLRVLTRSAMQVSS